jgi:hypothetical protein
VVGSDQTRQPDQGKMLAAGRFQPARAAQAVKIAIEPDFQQQARRIGRAAFAPRGNDKAQGGQIQLIDKLTQKTGGMIGRHPVFKSRRKEELLSVIGSDGLSHMQLDALSNELFKNTVRVLRQSPLRRPRRVQRRNFPRRHEGG